MKYIAAYALLVLGGNNAPSIKNHKYLAEDDITKLLKEAGVESVAADVKNVVSTLKGKNLNDVIKEGQKQLTSLSVGGGAQQSSAPAPQATTAAQTAPAAKVEPPKKAEEPEEDVDMGGLFD